MDLAVVVVCANDAHWLEACLQSVYAHAGAIELRAVIVDNDSSDGVAELVRARFPHARVLRTSNRGFAAGNNRGLEGVLRGARYALLLNPDTEILQGSLAELLTTLDRAPDVGIAGVCQVDGTGAPLATIRRFPSASRALGEALASERWPLAHPPAWAGERVLDPVAYTRAHDCDWVVGSFLLARREALLAAGLLDERFFLYCEEPDLCLRVARAGWRVRHLPTLTICHHAGKGGVQPRLVAQEAFARAQYARKHFPPARRGAYLGALWLRHALRAAAAPAQARRRASARALAVLAGRAAPPFGAPPAQALVAPTQTLAPGAQAGAPAARSCLKAPG